LDGRARRPGVRRADGGGLPGPRCNPHQPDYHLTFAGDLHPSSPGAKSAAVVAATLPSPCSPGADQSSSGGENDYFRTWQLQRNVSCPAATTAAIVPVRTRPTPASLRLLPGGAHLPRRAAPEHIYESPRLERRELALGSPAGGVGAECTCCDPPRRASVDLLQTGDPQSPIQYYELDQSARPAHL